MSAGPFAHFYLQPEHCVSGHDNTSCVLFLRPCPFASETQMASAHLAPTSKSIRKLTRRVQPRRVIITDDHVIMQYIMTRNDSIFDHTKVPAINSRDI